MIMKNLETDKKELMELFNELENEYQTGATLVFSKRQEDYFDPLKNQITICYKKQTLQEMKWILAHEFGHAVDYRTNKIKSDLIISRYKKRVIIFMCLILPLFIASKLLPFWFIFIPLILLMFSIRIISFPEMIDHKKKGELFSDHFANTHIGGGEIVFKKRINPIVKNLIKLIELTTVRVHPEDDQRRLECQKYPAKGSVFFPLKK